MSVMTDVSPTNIQESSYEEREVSNFRLQLIIEVDVKCLPLYDF